MNGDGTALIYVPTAIIPPAPARIYDNPQAGARLTGSGAPAGGLGNVGDTYVDTTNQNLWSKTNTGWYQR